MHETYVGTSGNANRLLYYMVKIILMYRLPIQEVYIGFYYNILFKSNGWADRIATALLDIQI